MAYPLALAALAVSAAGTGAQMIGQQKAKSAQAKAYQAERERQRGYQDQAATVANQSIAESGRTTADQSMAAAAAERAARFNAITSQAQPTRTGNTLNRSVSTGTGAVAETNRLAADNAARWNKILGGAQAKLGSYADWGLDREIAAQRAGRSLDRIGGDARRSAELLNLEMADAADAGANWQAGGQLASTLGSLGGMYAAVTPAAGAAAEPGSVVVDYTVPNVINPTTGWMELPPVYA